MLVKWVLAFKISKYETIQMIRMRFKTNFRKMKRLNEIDSQVSQWTINKIKERSFIPANKSFIKDLSLILKMNKTKMMRQE